MKLQMRLSIDTIGLILFFANGTLAFGAEAEAINGIIVESPGKKIKVEIKANNDGRLNWSVKRGDQTALSAAPLGLKVNDIELGESVTIGAPRRRAIDEQYFKYGHHAAAINRCQEFFVPVSCAGGIDYELHVRAYDDGAAVRLDVPLDNSEHRIEGESTSWGIPEGSRAWWAEYEKSYEEPGLAGALETIPENIHLGPPLTFEVAEEIYVAITEANNDAFPDMGLVRKGNRLQAVFPASQSGWRHRGRITTPWRAAIIAEGLNGLFNSDLIYNLCPPPSEEYRFAEWVKPGRSLWHWWAIGAPRLSDQKNWIDAARRLGFEYYLIDEGWRNWRDGEQDQWECLQEVIDYAKSQEVESLVWVNSSEMRGDESRRRYLKRVVKLGAAGIKIDFIPAATAGITRWYEGTLKDTAELKLLCNFHGAVKPTGRQRTWPHELAREGVRGHEWHMTRYRRVQAADHDQTIPFTRYLAGHADYTPTAFDPREMAGYTWGHLLAQAVNLSCPLMHFAGNYKDFVGNPAENFLRHLPSTWDETIILPGSEIGKTVAMARKKDNDWFLGILNGAEKTTMPIDLTFLEAGLWQVLIYGDNPGVPASFKIVTITVTPEDKLSFELSVRGGAVAWIQR